MYKYLYKYINRETITYIVAGVMTTSVNYVSYFWFSKMMGINTLIANVIAWVIAVTFAYVVNDLWVFRNAWVNIRKELEKVVKFFTARLCSLAIEEVGMFLFVSCLKWNDLLVKAFLAVFVIIANYLFSKIFVFNKSKKILEVEK